MSFLKPKQPAKVATATPAPERSSTEVTEAASEQRAAYQAGTATNLLTSGLGVTQAPTTAAAKLLGQTGRV